MPKKVKSEKENCREKVYDFLAISNKYHTAVNIAVSTKYMVSTVKRALKQLKDDEKVTYICAGHREFVTPDKYKYVKYWGLPCKLK